MIFIDPNKTDDIKDLQKLKYNEEFVWECTLCKQQHKENQLRNFKRRMYKCPCQERQIQSQEIQQALASVNYIFLKDRKDSYQLTKTGKIDVRKKIFVRCLKCGKESYEFYHNIRKNHKRCNCNETKCFSRNCSTEDFLRKWHPINQETFSLAANEQYINRNTKYRVICKRCQKEDIRWGISLIDSPLACKYCADQSIGESLVSKILENFGINYIREYTVVINKHQHRFDFFLPEYDIFIEYNGQQHFEPISYFGGEAKFKIRQERDLEKQKYCKEQHKPLLIIPYTLKYEEIKEKIGSMLNDHPAGE